MKRVFSIDAVRGIVMVIMALDNVRDLMHIHSISQSPTDMSTTTPVLFFTRWITYLCAPVFVFLAGTSAYISVKNKNDDQRSRRFLLTRGLWLMLLEFTVVNFGMFFDAGFHTLMFEVIATIGFGFVILSFLFRWKPATLAAIGLSIIFLHNLVPMIPLPQDSAAKNILSLLFSLKVIPLPAHYTFVMAYPPLPWLAIMVTGFAAGRLFAKSERKRNAIFLKLGIYALLLFIILRFLNFYGDPIPWTDQKNSVFTFLSFINITKYPPSLLFCLVTLGIMFLLFVFCEKLKGKFLDVISVYGKVPFFYFLLHFYFIHVLLILLLLAQGFSWADMTFSTGTFGRPADAPSGVSLLTVYFIWIFVVVVLYWPCRWYSRYKLQHKSRYWWLRYL